MKPTIPSSDAFWILSSGYLDAGDAIYEKLRSESYVGFALFPCVFSYFRSIELSIKAVLVHFGVTEDEITKSLGHRLSQLLLKAETFLVLVDIGILENERKLLDQYSGVYSNKWFEYPDTFWSDIPEPEELKDLAHRLCHSVQKYKRLMSSQGELNTVRFHDKNFLVPTKNSI